jgi:hypothetical protein
MLMRDFGVSLETAQDSIGATIKAAQSKTTGNLPAIH